MSHLDDVERNPYAAPITPLHSHHRVFQVSEPAGFWRRSAAFGLDWLLISAIGVVCDELLRSFLSSTGPAGLHVISTPMRLAVVLVYFGGMSSSPLQATLGKLLMGLKVTDLAGRRLSFIRAVLRELCKVLSFLTTLFLGCLMMQYTAKKQTLHDMLAGTLVLKTF